MGIISEQVLKETIRLQQDLLYVVASLFDSIKYEVPIQLEKKTQMKDMIMKCGERLETIRSVYPF